jgi:hypothetical protein
MAEKAEKGIRKRRRKASLGEWAENEKGSNLDAKMLRKQAFAPPCREQTREGKAV